MSARRRTRDGCFGADRSSSLAFGSVAGAAAPSMSRWGRKRWSQRRSHQLRSPSSSMVAGTSTRGTTDERDVDRPADVVRDLLAVATSAGQRTDPEYRHVPTG
jgi:hypothetical protein